MLVRLGTMVTEHLKAKEDSKKRVNVLEGKLDAGFAAVMAKLDERQRT